MRRIVQYPPSTHYSEINISPQWHQWLRHTRSEPPSLTEQSQDLIRQRNLKVLAAKADARWAAKPSVLDVPGQAKGQPLPALDVKDPGNYAQSTDPQEKVGVRSAVGGGLDDKIRRTDTTIKQATQPEEEPKMQLPDGIRHHFNKRPEQEKIRKAKEKKEREDPWKQARGGPSEEWQPKAWEGNITARRR